MSVVTHVPGEWLNVAVRAWVDGGGDLRQVLASVAPLIAKAERERVKKLVANECEDLMQRTKTPIQRAREDGHLSEECHQEGRWHGINDLLEYVEKIRALGDAT
jgi:hypothetical protein